MRAGFGRQLLALLIGAAPLYVFLLWHIGTPYAGEWAPERDSPLALITDGLWMLILGCGWLYLCLRYISRESLSELNLKPGTLVSDLRHGVLLMFAAYFVGAVAQNFVYGLPGYWESAAIEDMTRASYSGWAMVGALIFFDWTAAATFEETLRAFVISRFVRLADSTLLPILGVLTSAALFGLYHLYYGPYIAFVLFIEALVMGFYYLRYGRVVPLIVAHGLLNMSVTLFDLLAGPPA